MIINTEENSWNLNRLSGASPRGGRKLTARRQQARYSPTTTHSKQEVERFKRIFQHFTSCFNDKQTAERPAAHFALSLRKSRTTFRTRNNNFPRARNFRSTNIFPERSPLFASSMYSRDYTTGTGLHLLLTLPGGANCFIMK